MKKVERQPNWGVITAASLSILPLSLALEHAAPDYFNGQVTIAKPWHIDVVGHDYPITFGALLTTAAVATTVVSALEILTRKR